MANTTWNPSDKTASLTLSNGNLTATGTAAAIAGVRAVDKQVTGKFYWEITATTLGNISDAVGVASSAFVLSNGVTISALGTGSGLTRSGSVYVDGTGVSGIAFGTIANGTVIGIACDAGARLIWYRLGAAGNWNNSASANPATGVGGVSISIGVGIPVYPLLVLGAVSDASTANFGGSAFTGVVPSGFTSGFTAGASPATNALATQVALEEWARSNSLAQVTQVALEQWGTVSNLGTLAQVTQVALEQWGNVIPDIPTGMLVTQIGLEEWVKSNVTNPTMNVTQVAIEEWVLRNITNPTMTVTQMALEQWVRTPPPIPKGGGIWLVGL